LIFPEIYKNYAEEAMFLLGILAIFQIFLLPGLIFYRLYQIQGGFFFRLSAIFAISLISNSLIVFFLAQLKIYTRPVMLVLVVIEVLTIIWVYRSDINLSADQLAGKINGRIKIFFLEIKALFTSRQFTPAILIIRQIFQAIIFGLAVSLAIWFIRGFIFNIGSVFNTWDAVVAWNRNAQIWATNQIPDLMGMYPQLLPINLSLTYLFTANTEVVLFAKAIMPIFSTMIILTLFELSIEQKKTGYLIALIISYLMFKKFTGDVLLDGYADIPVTFMVFLAFVQVFKHPDLVSNKKELLLGGIFAAGAALTKQVGVYCLGIYPVVAFLSTPKFSKEKFKNVLLSTGISLLIAITWFFPKLILVMKDFANTNLFALTDVAANAYDNVPVLQRIVLSFESLGKYLLLYLLSIPFIFLVQKRFKFLIILFLLPFSVLWAIIASYDQRNLAITFPIIAVVIGLGLEKLMDLFLTFFSKLKFGKLSVIYLLGFSLIALVGVSFLVTNQTLLLVQREKQRLIFSPEINEQVYSLSFTQDGCSKILTNYPVEYLPGLENNQANSYFNDYESFQTLIKDPATCWILIPSNAISSIRQEIQDKINNGTYKLLYETNKWIPHQLVQIR
jgi:hypothetical protein